MKNYLKLFFQKTKNPRVLLAVYVSIIFLGVGRTYILEKYKIQETASMGIENKVIVIDAGHGGFDPGKVASNGTLEKDINLEIAKKLQTYLEQGGSYVTITRSSDESLSSKKREDLKNRKIIGNSKNIDYFISIHQNSFPQESVKGAQVFYYKDSEESKNLAESIQNRLKEADFGDRVAKENNQYYLLKEVKVPSVIVECGFLSNVSERNLLESGEYQEKIAWAIYLGLIDYIG